MSSFIVNQKIVGKVKKESSLLLIRITHIVVFPY